jgi:hypothetical protein
MLLASLRRVNEFRRITRKLMMLMMIALGQNLSPKRDLPNSGRWADSLAASVDALAKQSA